MQNAQLIENYLKGKLKGAELDAFLLRLQQDQEFAMEVAMQKQIMQGIQTQGRRELKRELEAIHQNMESSSKPTPAAPSRIRKLLPYLAAASVLLLGIIGWYFFSTPNPQQLYASYYQPYGLTLNYRGEEENSLSEINRLYRNKEYNTVLPQLETLLKTNPGQNQLRLGLAICYLETGQTDRALAELNTIYLSKDPFLLEQATWYIALIQLQKNNLLEAKKMLLPLAENPAADHHAEAKALLQKIK